MTDVVLEKKPEVSDTSGIKPLKRHIVKRKNEGGQLTDCALCGAIWDMVHPTTGEICKECLEIYKKMHPGWPIPR